MGRILTMILLTSKEVWLLLMIYLRTTKSEDEEESVSNRKWDFTDSYMTVTPAETQTPVEIQIKMHPRMSLNATDVIWIQMPRFTSGDGTKTPGENIERGSLRIGPSVYFEAEWIEGEFNDEASPYYNSTLKLYVKPSRWIESGVQVDVFVYASNGIRVYCGFDMASRSPDQGFSIRTNASNGNNDPAPLEDSVFVGNGCNAQLDCLNRGNCNYCTERCECYENFGDGNAQHRGAIVSVDCTLTNCPVGLSWSGLPFSSTEARVVATCSDAGLCEEQTGTCQCFDGFDGIACERMACFNDCSGHGQCLTMAQLAFREAALPLSAINTLDARYGSHGVTSAWDADIISGCLCDSSWPVGLGAGQRQEPEFFGPDCSLRRCPSADDPSTAVTDETDCSNTTALGGFAAGDSGNLCQVDCANRGLCDTGDTDFGRCTCFPGYSGAACERLEINSGAIAF